MKDKLKRVISLFMIILMVLSTTACLSGISLAADTIMETEPNDGSNTATLIPTDTLCNGTTTTCDDTDWYKFTTNKNYFTISFVVDSTLFDLDAIKSGWQMIIYTESGEELKNYKEITSTTVTAILPITGTFFVQIKAFNQFWSYAPTGCSYGLKVDTTTDHTWEKEWNDTSATANNICADVSYSGILHGAKDSDWFLFENNSGAFNFEFSLDTATSYDDTKNGWRISVFKYGSASPIVTYKGIDSNLESFDIPYKGKILINVIAENQFSLNAPVDCIYNLKVSQHHSSELWEREENNTVSTATIIENNKKYNANLTAYNDDDYFIFTSPYNGTFDIEFSRDIADDLGGGWKIKAVGTESGEVLNVSNVCVNNQTYTAKFINAEKGEKYTILVEANSSSSSKYPIQVNYSIKVTARSHSYTSKVTRAVNYKSTGVKTYTCKNCGDTYSETIARLTLSKVSGLKASSIKTTSIKFTWSKVTGAEKYEVYYSTNGKSWKKVTATKNSVTIKKLKSGTTYKVKVRAVAGSNKGSYSSVLTTSTKPVKATLSTLKSTKKKQAVATWKTISGVTGYEVTYSTSKKFTKKTTKTATVKKAKTKKTTLKKLKSGKKYYVKVRAYKTVNGKKIYGAYSKVMTVKVK